MSHSSTVPPLPEAFAGARPDLALAATINLTLAALGHVVAVFGGAQLRIEPTAGAETDSEELTEEQASSATQQCLIDRTMFLTWATRLLVLRAKEQG